MALRPTMANLIDRLRRLIADPSGANQVWTDNDLQDFLDGHRREARYAQLCPVESISASGSVSYLIFESEQPNWEGADSSGPELVDASFAVISSSDYTADLLTGRWVFASQPSWPIRITGWCYDLYGAAVDALEAWAAQVKLSFDVSADQQSFKRSQKFDMLQQMADKYRKRMWVGSAPIRQTDFNAHAS